MDHQDELIPAGVFAMCPAGRHLPWCFAAGWQLFMSIMYGPSGLTHTELVPSQALRSLLGGHQCALPSLHAAYQPTNPPLPSTPSGPPRCDLLLYSCATSAVYSGRFLQGLTAISTGPALV